MREIKFRAWNKRDKRMLHWGSSLIAIDHQLNVHTVPSPGCFIAEDIELMEHTGLKDKNGVEIYEGDIVSSFGQDVHQNKIENRFPVCFGSYDNDENYENWVGGNGWYLGQELFFRSGEREAGSWESKCRHLIDTDVLEIIGNIYENPELLEK